MRALNCTVNILNVCRKSWVVNYVYFFNRRYLTFNFLLYELMVGIVDFLQCSLSAVCTHRPVYSIFIFISTSSFNFTVGVFSILSDQLSLVTKYKGSSVVSHQRENPGGGERTRERERERQKRKRTEGEMAETGLSKKKKERKENPLTCSFPTQPEMVTSLTRG